MGSASFKSFFDLLGMNTLERNLINSLITANKFNEKRSSDYLKHGI